MHPLNGALPVPYVLVQVSHGAVHAHLILGRLMHCFAAEPRRNAGVLYLSVSLWNDLANPIFNGVGLAAFKRRANAFLLA